MSDEFIQRVIDGVAQGRITEAEADYLLRKERNVRLDQALESYTPTAMPLVTEPAQTPTVGVTEYITTQGPDTGKALPILAGIAFTVVLVGLIFYFGGGPTGLVVLNLPLENVTNATYAVDQNITGLNISGILYGEGNASVWFDTPSGTLLAGSFTSDTGIPRTDKASYALGDTISVEHAPSDATYYFDDGIASATVTPPFPATTNGTLLLVANESGTLTTYRLPIILGDAIRAVAFADVCIETCTFQPTTGVIRIETQGNAQLELTGVHADIEQANVPPELIIPFAPATIENQATINLSGHFTDANDDTLYYSVSVSDLIDARVEGDQLILAPLRNGTDTLSIYASDLRDITRTTIDITSITPETANATANETNVTANATENITTNITSNETLNLTENATGNETNASINMTGNGTVDCSNPNPNERPLECIQGENSSYFRPGDINLENHDGVIVGRLTPVGNLLIKGTVAELSTGTPGARDYSLGYTNDVGDFVPTIWIDSTTGDLHLRGRLIEANGNIPQIDGWTTFISMRGIILAQADRSTGDLTVRGNVVPYRRSFG